jgi:uncharacterized SAM-binding protein YcdF (DUF218 family)
MTNRFQRTKNSSINRRGRLMIFSCGLIIIVWIMGLIWFVDKVPTNRTDDHTRTDSIIVLTGGTGRLEAGLQLLSEGYAKLLFISGVARGLDVQALLKLFSGNRSDFVCCIIIGYRADNTAGNAVETAKWIVENKFNSLRLVTASYHMPRSLFEFRRKMPNIKIVPHPVFPPQFKRQNWWRWPGSAQLLASEFNKYLISKIGLNRDDWTWEKK